MWNRKEWVEINDFKLYFFQLKEMDCIFGCVEQGLLNFNW